MESNDEINDTPLKLGFKRQVTFDSSKENLLHEKPLILSRSTSSPTKINRRRLRTISRSNDERISFRGPHTIYTAGDLLTNDFYI